ncbi:MULTISPECIES: hypothetical protein [unclassified Paraburkholderia]|uniref:hypothetical protein n=1 Tax=unclassified Paraburkholderia TaxID=2615204 RepID=UPI001609594C|nr:MULTISPECIES: hypothetical protein [unclassified Paraburkholderia]MBB5447308.1 hypothetical protein [Paraburkholderia sp. WSM4177]MBB5487848.1 hypothetical protein [Paraburkholderia sp. WSM4180]
MMALAPAEQSVRFILPGSAEYGAAKARVSLLHNGLRLMRGGLGVATKRHDLGELLVEICRERAASTEWQHIVYEARRRYDAQGNSRTAAHGWRTSTRYKVDR